MNNQDDLNLEYLCQNALSIARIAGKKILEIYDSKFTIEHKSDNTPLTTADLAADRIIQTALKELTPDIPVLTEESDSVPFEIRKQWNRYWLVDPLDGTREFIKRNGEFTVNIALIENHRSIIGVINAPVLQTDYFAWKEGHAFKKTLGQPIEQIYCRKANPEKLVIAGSRSHPSDNLQAYLEKLGNVELLSVGSSLKSCMVAEGSVDLYPRLGLTSEWDTAAAHCIVEEAGGMMTQTDSSDLLYNTKDSLLNPEFFVFGDNTIKWKSFL
ncbi:MAG: 3'(2'),5'-bisphosphate nucleotidase [endosymbiont of Galathealinum brachiosum]|uniref:3'(2'),5'-bisphosphate nucleotidase CysQ n=1 Tax=endosymbiont of Galathealinum brachiosum TaxID=2200906 RepID=A0A370DBR3_9GAMM|nr:MAG: 3'(2'),5'-bisphosphate nucleotidase [endosymbiont of Galathealinum brachiosum]